MLYPFLRCAALWLYCNTTGALSLYLFLEWWSNEWCARFLGVCSFVSVIVSQFYAVLSHYVHTRLWSSKEDAWNRA